MRTSKPHDEDVDGYSFGEVPHRNQIPRGLRPGCNYNASGLCGEAELILSSVTEEEGALEITFGYSLNGIPVFLSPNGWAAQFRMREGAVTEFTLYFRNYSPSGETTSLLPELQAAAALEAMDPERNELILAYHDAGTAAVTAGWIAR